MKQTKIVLRLQRKKRVINEVNVSKNNNQQ